MDFSQSGKHDKNVECLAMFIYSKPHIHCISWNHTFNMTFAKYVLCETLQ